MWLTKEITISFDMMSILTKISYEHSYKNKKV